MKKTLLLATAALVSMSCFAQSGDQRPATTAKTVDANPLTFSISSESANKGTGYTQALYYVPYAGQRTGPFTNYYADYASPYDSGRLNGINVYGNKGYAQYYPGNADAVAPADTTLQIMGLVSRWGGRVATGSSKTVVFGVWKRDTGKYPVTGRSKFYIVGLPQATAVATKTVNLTALVINGKTLDSGNTFTYFTTPISGVNYDFYAGYTIAYTWAGTAGDTVGLSTVAYASGAGAGSGTIDAALDTLVTSYTAVQTPSGTWKSTFEPDISSGGNLIVYPIIKFVCPNCIAVGVKGFTSTNLTMYGSYPNPAQNTATVKFALKNRTDVTISVMDAAGRTVKVVKETGLASGMHMLNVDVSSLAAGTYVYLVRTGDGDGLASQFTIAK